MKGVFIDEYYELWEMILAWGIGFLLIALVFLIAILVVYLVGLSKLFKKANQPSWAAIVPFYNSYILTKTASVHWMYFLFLLADFIIISFLGIEDLKIIAKIISYYGLFVCYYNIAKKFNKGIGFAILTFFFPYVCIPILGFSKNYQYNQNVAVSEHAFFGESRSNVDEFEDNKDNNIGYCSNCGSKIDKNYNKFCPNCGKEVLK